MSTAEHLDGKYYQVVAPRSLSERLVILARDRIYADFIRRCRPTPRDKVLDVGVSDVINDAANVLEREYPHPENITAVGLGAGSEFRAAYPRVAYQRIDANRLLPYPDKCFDIATSNAVLEHVGSRWHQELHVSELMRVARKVFISVPNRFFPVEHHTAIPLLHYSDATFAFACSLLDKREWADEQNLILMSKGRLASLAKSAGDAAIETTGIKLGPFSSNLLLFIDQST